MKKIGADFTTPIFNLCVALNFQRILKPVLI